MVFCWEIVANNICLFSTANQFLMELPKKMALNIKTVNFANELESIVLKALCATRKRLGWLALLSPRSFAVLLFSILHPKS